MKSSDTMQQFRAHWSDLASRCIRDSRPYFTDFVPVEDVPAAESIARSAGAVCTAWGGTENTTRVMLCFAPEFIPVEPEQFPIQCLRERNHFPHRLHPDAGIRFFRRPVHRHHGN